ncbi:MAG: hypothetical protein KatS3mg103_0640 [Phycisphaerales bacterium]|nr:MAG: hypothetical protein KatS3mg103_0640 [Phycisphaerales bacterium]
MPAIGPAVGRPVGVWKPAPGRSPLTTDRLRPTLGVPLAGGGRVAMADGRILRQLRSRRGQEEDNQEDDQEDGREEGRPHARCEGYPCGWCTVEFVRYAGQQGPGLGRQDRRQDHRQDWQGRGQGLDPQGLGRVRLGDRQGEPGQGRQAQGRQQDRHEGRHQGRQGQDRDAQGQPGFDGQDHRQEPRQPHTSASTKALSKSAEKKAAGTKPGSASGKSSGKASGKASARSSATTSKVSAASADTTSTAEEGLDPSRRLGQDDQGRRQGFRKGRWQGQDPHQQDPQ